MSDCSVSNKACISVIVPVYKVEPYLDRCVQSVVNQTYPNLEIILVDDGSPDQCPVMCDTWAKKDPRIRVIHKKNGGLSDARNAGMAAASGEYISFVDSDDWIAPEMLERLVKALERDDSDIAACAVEMVWEDGRENKTLTVLYLIYKNAFEYGKYGLADAQGMVLFVLIGIMVLAQYKLTKAGKIG